LKTGVTRMYAREWSLRWDSVLGRREETWRFPRMLV
jgi:hypothetical protein